MEPQGTLSFEGALMSLGAKCITITSVDRPKYEVHLFKIEIQFIISYDEI